jgi:uncharacterized protein with GYD domain
VGHGDIRRLKDGGVDRVQPNPQKLEEEEKKKGEVGVEVEQIGYLQGIYDMS